MSEQVQISNASGLPASEPALSPTLLHYLAQLRRRIQERRGRSLLIRAELFASAAI